MSSIAQTQGHEISADIELLGTKLTKQNSLASDSISLSNLQTEADSFDTESLFKFSDIQSIFGDCISGEFKDEFKEKLQRLLISFQKKFSQKNTLKLSSKVISKVIQKPFDQKQKVWYSNHITKIKKLLQEDCNYMDAVRYDMPLKKIKEIDFSQYTKRSRMMFTKSKKKKLPLDPIELVDGAVYVYKQLVPPKKVINQQKVKEEAKDQQIQLEEIKSLLKDEDKSAVCICQGEIKYCKSLWGESFEAMTLYGCEYATKFFSYFQNQPNPQTPLFWWHCGHLMQSETLILKCTKIDKIISMHMKSCAWLSSLLGNKIRKYKSTLSPHFRIVHEQLRVQLRQYKFNYIEMIIGRHLREIMPLYESQRKLINSFSIQINFTKEVQFHPRRRAIMNENKVVKENEDKYTILRLQLNKLQELRNQLEDEDFKTNQRNPIMQAITLALLEEMQGKSDSFTSDVHLIKIGISVVQDFSSIRIQRTLDDKGLIESVQSYRICRRVLGFEMYDELMRRFRLTCQNGKRIILIPPQYMKWFWIIKERIVDDSKVKSINIFNQNQINKFQIGIQYGQIVQNVMKNRKPIFIIIKQNKIGLQDVVKESKV